MTGIEAEVTVLGALRGKPVGALRITATEHAARTLIRPRLLPRLPKCADIGVENIGDNRIVDIVSERFDIGVRLAGDVAKAMVAMRIAPDLPRDVVGRPISGGQYRLATRCRRQDEPSCRPKVVGGPAPVLVRQNVPVVEIYWVAFTGALVGIALFVRWLRGMRWPAGCIPSQPVKRWPPRPEESPFITRWRTNVMRPSRSASIVLSILCRTRETACRFTGQIFAAASCLCSITREGRATTGAGAVGHRRT